MKPPITSQGSGSPNVLLVCEEQPVTFRRRITQVLFKKCSQSSSRSGHINITELKISDIRAVHAQAMFLEKRGHLFLILRPETQISKPEIGTKIEFDADFAKFFSWGYGGSCHDDSTVKPKVFTREITKVTSNGEMESTELNPPDDRQDFCNQENHC